MMFSFDFSRFSSIFATVFMFDFPQEASKETISKESSEKLEKTSPRIFRFLGCSQEKFSIFIFAFDSFQERRICFSKRGKIGYHRYIRFPFSHTMIFFTEIPESNKTTEIFEFISINSSPFVMS
jgi:hypothetical protein